MPMFFTSSTLSDSLKATVEADGATYSLTIELDNPHQRVHITGLSAGDLARLQDAIDLGVCGRTVPDNRISTDPADYDGVLPHCSFCTDAIATKRCNVGGALACDGCYDEWLMGRFDVADPLRDAAERG